MADPPATPKDGTPSSRRPRAPTITIDTTNVKPDDGAPATEGDKSAQLAQPSDDNQSPTMTRGSQTSSQRTAVASRPDLSEQSSFDSRDSRPTSPHNVSSPVNFKGGDGKHAFLAVPSNLRSRQNSIESEDTSRSIVSETVVGGASQSGARPRAARGESSRDAATKIKEDARALEPDQGQEESFVVENNPFAFSPGQLNKMFNPKSLSAFWRLGGLGGLEEGLRTDRIAGLSVEESNLDGSVSFEAVTPSGRQGDNKKATGLGKKATAPSQPVHNSGGECFVDRKRVYKDNRLPERKGKSLLQLMWITYNDKVLILLSVAAVVSLAIGLYQTFGVAHKPEDGAPVDWVEGVAIMVAIFIVVVVGSLNDYQKERQFAKLNRRKSDRLVKVIRSGKTVELSVFDILAGDVVHLEPGDMIPVDGILIKGFNVKCDESQATGESDVLKKTGGDEVFAAIENGADLKKLDPFIQSGGRVMEGVGTFLVTSTGVNSSYGKTLMSLDEPPEITPLQSKLNVIAEYIAKLGGAAGLLLFIVLFILFCVRLPKQPADVTPAQKGQQFLNIFIVVVTIIVVAVPEGLPLAVTLALAFATTRMLKDNNLVRHLKACEVMGNATQICSDKTGTLTQNKMQVVSGSIGTAVRFGDSGVIEDESPAESEASGVDVSPQEATAMLSSEVKELLLKSIALNSTAFEGEIDGQQSFIGSKTETAMLIFAKEHLAMGPVSEARANAKVLQLYPFDSGRKSMGVVVQLPDGRARFFVKGASEIVLGMCNQILRDPAKDASAAPMSDENRETVSKLITAYASNSLRTIGIIYRDFDKWPPPRARRVDKEEIAFADISRHMIFVSLVGIKDPLRPGVLEAVRQCQHAGVIVRMVTGDNKVTAEAIARDCGILQPESIVMEGPEFRNLSKLQQEEILPRLHVMARSSPEDKRILVRRLKDKGETVAVTGDGTNDAPALKLADVGFSMGIAGTEVAKEASAIILMDDNFASIVKALKWGRAVNDAVKRFLQFQLTVNITAVLLTFVTAVSDSGENSVLTAVQLLWVNLIMDTLAALALATDPPNDSLLNRRPERRGASMISTTMWKMILGQAVYQLAITFLIYYGGANVLPFDDNASKSQVQTLVFNTFVWMQIFNQWNNRRLDNNFNIFEGLFKNWFFIAISAIMIGGQVLIVKVGGAAFSIASDGQTNSMWAYAIILGVLSIPVGVIIRLIPNQFLEALVPDSFKRRAHSNVPGLTVSDEERFNAYPVPFAEVRDELTFLKRMKGGRLNNLRFAVTHPRDFIMARSPSHSREHSRTELREGGDKTPSTPTRGDSYSSYAPTPDSRRRSRSMRSRSNSALGASMVMSGIVAGSIAAGWSPTARSGQDREFGSFPRPSVEQQRKDYKAGDDKEMNMSGGALTDEPQEMEDDNGGEQAQRAASSEVPRLKLPQPPGDKERKSFS